MDDYIVCWQPAGTNFLFICVQEMSLINTDNGSYVRSRLQPIHKHRNRKNIANI